MPTIFNQLIGVVCSHSAFREPLSSPCYQWLFSGLLGASSFHIHARSSVPQAATLFHKPLAKDLCTGSSQKSLNGSRHRLKRTKTSFSFTLCSWGLRHWCRTGSWTFQVRWPASPSTYSSVRRWWASFPTHTCCVKRAQPSMKYSNLVVSSGRLWPPSSA